MASKHTRLSFKKASFSHKFELLELVYSNVYGPLKTNLLTFYFIIFYGDYFMKLRVYTLKTKTKCRRSLNTYML